MKKVLMVMGFALCASVAFAQTARISATDDARKFEKAKVSDTKAPVDYKASIFAKANGHDTITVFKMDVATDYTIGQVQSSDRINDTLVGGSAHNVSGDANRWMRIPSVAAYRSNPNTYTPGLAAWSARMPGWIADDIDPELSPREPADDGFMMLSYMETNLEAGRFNAYFTLPTVQRPSDAVMIEVSLTQSYIKYYDRCYIDYQVNGKWFAREVNVDGIDAAVNSWSANKVRYVMPYALNPEQNINLRLRGYSWHRGSAFGYFWAVDNVAILKLTNTEFWSLNSPTNIDGFYGMIPQGMEIPITWAVNAQNLSVDNINNAHVTLNAGTTRDNLTAAMQGPNVNVLTGNFDTVYPLLLNERGFYVEDRTAESGYQSWPNEGTHTNYGNAGLPSGFQGRGLPVNTTGKNFYSINVAGGSLSRTYDTILYYVSPMREGNNIENGYRWSHDNGIIPVGASFQVAFTNDGYVTPNGSDDANGGHANMQGYAVHTRFITGNDIPEGWVFRGIELIPATDRDASDMIQASIVPIAYVDVYEEDGLSFNSLPCGIDGLAFLVGDDDINSTLVENNLGYLTAEQGYKSINISFAEQPALEPNTSYRFGYRLNDDARFAVAGTRRNFQYTNDTGGVVNIGFGYGMGENDTITEYATIANNAHDYRYQQAPATYLEVMAYDPVRGEYVTAWNIDNYPMIRPIVGPARPVVPVTIEGDCLDNTDSNGVMISRNNDQFCNGFISVPAGSTQRIDFDPIGDHSVIDSVIYNGVKLPAYDQAQGIDGYRTGDASVYQHPENPQPDEILLQRDYWYYYLTDIAENSEHVFQVYSHWEEFDNVGIDPIAPEVSLGLAPNPATSSVKLNIKGVSGMVNCSILDMSGRVIYNANINAESEHMINVSSIPAGAYFVRVTNDTFSKIEKLIIK